MEAGKMKSVAYADVKLPADDGAKKKRLDEIEAVFGTRSVPKIKKYLEDNNIEQVKVAVFDIDGIMRGKYIARGKFLSALEKGFGFCDVIFGWDSNDQLYDSAE